MFTWNIEIVEFICPACYNHTAGHQTPFGDSTVSLLCSNCVDSNKTDILACCGAPLEHGSQGPVSHINCGIDMGEWSPFLALIDWGAQPGYSFLTEQFLKSNFHQGLTQGSFYYLAIWAFYFYWLVIFWVGVRLHCMCIEAIAMLCRQ